MLNSSEISDARFLPIDQLADLMPDHLARRVAEAANHDTATYLEHRRVTQGERPL